MAFTDTLRSAYQGIGRSIQRFPTTVLFLISVAVLNSLMIENSRADYSRYLFTFLIGAALSAVGQMVFERFSLKSFWRHILMGGALLLTIGYFFLVGTSDPYNIEISVKTSVALFSLAIAFVWIPSISSSKLPFYRSFLSSLKALFVSIVFSVVLAIGIAAIFYATDYLLFNINDKILAHLLNLVGSIFAPIYFLSITPLFPSIKEELIPDEAWSLKGQNLQQHFIVSRFLEILISYIVIPLTAIYTLILVVYLASNIRGEFWSDNLLESLLVSYAILVIVVLFLSYNLENKFTVLFRTISPKILVPVVVFQTIASFLKIGEMGITYGRYYVIMFGVFATVAGLVFSFLKPRHHSWIVMTLIAVSAISIVPPIDAFTISKNSQLTMLEEKLNQYGMLVANDISPKDNLPMEDKIILTRVVTYIDNMGYNNEVPYLPDDFNVYQDFKSTFGFDMAYSNNEFQQAEGDYAYLNWDADTVVGIQGFDIMIHQPLYRSVEDSETLDTTSFEVNGQSYELEIELSDNYYLLTIKDDGDRVLMTYNTKELYDNLFNASENIGLERAQLTVEDALFSMENDQIRMNILVNSLERLSEVQGGDVYLFIEIK